MKLNRSMRNSHDSGFLDRIGGTGKLFFHLGDDVTGVQFSVYYHDYYLCLQYMAYVCYFIG